MIVCGVAKTPVVSNTTVLGAGLLRFSGLSFVLIVCPIDGRAERTDIRRIHGCRYQVR